MNGRFAILGLAFLVVSTIPSFSDTMGIGTEPSSNNPTDSSSIATRRRISNLSWTTDKWTGDDLPLVEVRGIVDAQAKRPGFDKAVGLYETAYRENPKSAVAEFTWLYAAWIEGDKSRSGVALDKSIERMDSDVDFTNLGNTYNGARIRFLYQADIDLQPNLRFGALGERLYPWTGNANN